MDLLCRGVAQDAQAGEETMAVIESEVARMSRLVADLLLLARVDAGVQLETDRWNWIPCYWMSFARRASWAMVWRCGWAMKIRQ